MITNLTDITIVLDKSGSMAGTRQATIDGFNEFIDDQREVPGEANVSLVQFGSAYTPDYTAQPIANVQDLSHSTYNPNEGSTRLYDSVCRAIDETGQRLAAMDEAQRPGKVIMVIYTDGLENDSRQFNENDVKQRIEHQRETYKWEFLFLGANQDAMLSATRIGIDSGKAMTYATTSRGIGASYKSLANTVSLMRSAHDAADMTCFNFCASDYAAQDAELTMQGSSITNANSSANISSSTSKSEPSSTSLTRKTAKKPLATTK